MPEPVKRGQRYMPGLDGLRAIAVLAVVAYHLEFSWARGGLLGVGVFFTLSGYLITDLLLAQVASRGRIHLKSFWLARARRLLPALVVMLVVVLAWVTVIGPHQAPDFKDAAASGLFYFNNWWLIFHNVSYFAQFAAPAPLNHLWSLSIEEQFYIVWPFMLTLGLAVIREPGGSNGLRPRLAAVTLALAIVSAIGMIVLYHPGLDPSRVYYGTDTRAQEILLGAVLAMLWPSRRLSRKVTAGARRVIDGSGAVGLAVIVLLLWRAGEYSPFLYRGGFLLLSLATVVVVAALSHPATRLGRVVGCRPMRWIGERSYGIYLWHFPIIVLTTPEGDHAANPVRAFFQVTAIGIVAALSWKYVEDPIRHGALGRYWKRMRAGAWRRETLSPRARAVTLASGLVLAAAIAGLAGVGDDPSKANQPGGLTVAETITAGSDTKSHGNPCHSVVHIGDSTSEGLISANYLPNRKQRIPAQYKRIGATTQHIEISGARSIYETFEGNPNAAEVAQAWKSRGFDGCWVLALGTNDTANVAAGSTFGLDQRIDKMMSVLGKEPVLWVNVRSLLTSGPYAEAGMLHWNAALKRACDRYPHMRIYDWASDVKDSWFIDDGIHYTTIGYAARSRLIADALHEAFPPGEPVQDTDNSSCIVDPGAPKASGSVSGTNPG